MFRLYLDQMLQVSVAGALRGDGHDVLRASETGSARSDDRDILERAVSDDRIVVTLDRHFGDWVVLPLTQHPGVIRLRIHPTTSANILSVLIPFLRGHKVSLFRDRLVILSSKRARWIRTGWNPS